MKGLEIIEGTLDTIYFFYFLADSLTNLDVFLAKTFLIPREIIPQNLVVSEELGNKQTDRLTDRHALLYSIRITVKEEFESSKLFGEEFWCSGEAKRILFVKSTSNITRILIMK